MSRFSRPSPPPDARRTAAVIRAALTEDLGAGDITTRAIVPSTQQARAVLIAREPGIVAGLGVARAVFHARSRNIRFRALTPDGARVRCRQHVARMTGSLHAILTAERVALNLLSRLSGIATMTRRFVDSVRPFGVKILDTRKTTPLLRDLEKYAVRAGGGTNHRRNLATAVLVKDNHIAAAGSIGEAMRRARRSAGGRLVEVEVENLSQLASAVAAGPDVVMLDNFGTRQAKLGIALVRKASRRIGIEISGGVDLSNVTRYARLRPDFISVGAITHSASGLDFSLEID